MATAHSTPTTSHGQSAGDAPYEHDVEGKGLVTLVVYGVVLSAAFFATLGALFVYFRWEADEEISRKVNQYESTELAELRKRESAELNALDPAMKAIAESLRQPGAPIAPVAPPGAPLTTAPPNAPPATVVPAHGSGAPAAHPPEQPKEHPTEAPPVEPPAPAATKPPAAPPAAPPAP